MKSFNQAVTVFSEMTAMRAAEKARAKACLALLGTKRIVGHLRLHTASKEGKSEEHWLDETSNTGASVEEHCAEHFRQCETRWEVETSLTQEWHTDKPCSMSHESGIALGRTPLKCRLSICRRHIVGATNSGHPRTQHCLLPSAVFCATGPLTGHRKSIDNGDSPVGYGDSGAEDGSMDNEGCTTAGAKDRFEKDDCDGGADSCKVGMGSCCG
eukprot:Em0005g1434a